MIEAALRRLARFSRRHYRSVFLITVAVALVALLAARNLRFDTGIRNLLPADDEIVRTFTETVESFGSLDLLLVVVRIPEGVVVDPYLDFIDRLGPRIEQLAEVDSVDYSLGAVEDLVRELLPRAPLLLDGEGRREIAERLSDAGIERRVGELRRRVSTPQALYGRALMQLDPLGITEVFLADFAERRGAGGVDWSQGYLLSRDDRLALVVARPVLPAMESDFGRRLLAAVETVVAEVLAQWQEIAGPDPPPAPTIDLGGSYVTAVEEANDVASDVALSGLTAMLGVLVLFALAFRRLSLVGYALVPLSVGLILGFGFAGGVFGVLSVVSSSFAALLLGLALDFVIVSYGRYVEERRRGADLSDALAAMAGTSGRAVVTGAVTTAATFYSFTITEFAGLRQMGILTGTSILFCMLAVLVLLPAMLAWSEDRYRKRSAGGVRDLTLHAFGLGQLVGVGCRHPVPVLLLGGTLTLSAAVLAPRLKFEEDINRLRPAGSRGVAVQNEVAEAFGSGFGAMLLVIKGASEEQVLERVHRAERGARRLVEEGVLIGTDSIASLIPSAAEQAAALAWIDEHRELLDRERLLRVFSREAASEGLRSEAFADGLDLLSRAGEVRAPLTIEDLAASPLTEKLLSRWVYRDEAGTTAVVYLESPPGLWVFDAPPEALALAAELGSGVVLTGANLIGERLRQQIRIDALTACIVGFVLVAAVLYFDYRRAADAALALVPLSVGMLWMLGGMVVLGLEMNFFNIFVTTMIIGIGVDYGIHMVNRYRESSAASVGQLEADLKETGRAVVLAALSTTVGFGSLSLSHYPGVRSMGLVAILGALATATVAVVVLPALLSVGRRRRSIGD